MTRMQGVTWIALEFCLWVLVAVAIWRCFRRTQARSFLCLGALLLLWPPFAKLTSIACVQLAMQASGKGPSFFPFSLVASGRVSVGQFVTWYGATMSVLHSALLAVTLMSMARFFRRASAGSGFPVVVAQDRALSPDANE